jgi:hypothetical protein
MSDHAILSLELCSRCCNANLKFSTGLPSAKIYAEGLGHEKGGATTHGFAKWAKSANATLQSSVSWGMPACAFLPLWFLGALPGRISGCSGLEGNFGPAGHRLQSCRSPEPPRRKQSGRACSRDTPGSEATPRDLVGMERPGRCRIRCNGPHGSARSSNVRPD